jgi:Raf kinase inhibitor-like YbhB/YbcL family protein
MNMSLILTSESFKEGEYLGQEHVLSAAYGFGCEGGNLSPQLSWSGAPADTKSFAVTCYDPDAPTGSGFWHWVVANIPASVSSLPLGAGDPASGRMPAGALEVRTDFSKPGYGGPCPPPGAHVHRYIFTVHAVSMAQLPVTADTSAAIVGFYLNFNTLAKASLIGLFKR